MVFYPENTNIIAFYEEKEKHLNIVNLVNNRLFNIQTNEYLNCINFVGDTLYLGSALEGRLLCIKPFSEIVRKILTEAENLGNILLHPLYINTDGKLQLEFDKLIEKDTIYTTPYM